MLEDKIQRGLDNAYKGGGGMNIYFESGFREGVAFVLSEEPRIELQNDLYASHQNNIALKQELMETREQLDKACETIATAKKTQPDTELFWQLFNTATTAFWLYTTAPQVHWIVTAFMILIMWMLVTPYTED